MPPQSLCGWELACNLVAVLLAHQSLWDNGEVLMLSLVGDFARGFELAAALQSGTGCPLLTFSTALFPFSPQLNKQFQGYKTQPLCSCPPGISAFAQSLGRSWPRAPAYRERIIMALMTQSTAPAWKEEGMKPQSVP